MTPFNSFRQQHAAPLWCAGLLLASLSMPAHAGFFDDLTQKAGALVDSAKQALTLDDPEVKAFLAKKEDEQDAELESLRRAGKDAELYKRAKALHEAGLPSSATGTFYLSVAYGNEKNAALPAMTAQERSAKIKELLGKAAQAGNWRAQTGVGVIVVLRGEQEFAGVSMDTAKKYLIDGAERNDDAAEVLASLYEEGSPQIPQDLDKALALYQTHKWEDPAKWQPKIATLQAELAPPPSVDGMLKLSSAEQFNVFKKLLDRKKHAEFFKLASGMAAKKSAVGNFYTGYGYENGFGVDKNWSKAIVHWQEAVAGKNKNAMLRLGMEYVKGENIQINVVKGASLLEQAAAEPDPGLGAAYALGGLYDLGTEGFPANQRKALEWYRKVKEPNFAPDAQKRVAALEEDLKPLPTVAELMQMSPDQQFGSLKKIEDKKRFTELLALAKGIHEHGAVVGTFFLGAIHINGWGVPEDEKLGAQYWIQAADAGYATAQMKMGDALISGWWGLTKDNAQAMKYYQGCFDVYYACALQVAKAHAFGWGGWTVNKPKAVEILKNHNWGNYAKLAEVKSLVKQLDPMDQYQDIFVKVMEAAKIIGVKVTDVRTIDDQFYGEGTLSINGGSIRGEFNATLRVFEGGAKPLLYLTLNTGDWRANKAMREKMVDALGNKFGNLRSAFHAQSTMFVNEGWTQ